MNIKRTLEILFEKSVDLGEAEYTDVQIRTKWIGNPPATLEEIENTEKRLGLKLPQDYIDMVSVANGFPASLNSVEPDFQRVEEIDFYRNHPWNVIDTWKEIGGLDDVVQELEKAILIAGTDDEQQFLLIPPGDGQSRWKYWKFAMWIPGEEEYRDLQAYFERVIDFLNGQLAGKQK